MKNSLCLDNFFTVSKHDRFFRSNRYQMLFFGILTNKILQVMFISNDQCWLQPIYFNKYPIPEKLMRSSFLYLSDLPDLTEMLIVKTQLCLVSAEARLQLRRLFRNTL